MGNILEDVNQHVSQLSATITKYLRQLIKRKGLFWLTVLEVPVHDQFGSLALGL
jgi:hypothetical protein